MNGLEESFAGYISFLRRQFVQYCSEKLAELGVTYGQLFVVIFVGKRENCAPKEVTQALKLDAGQLNRMIVKLIEQGILVQRKNEQDKRANIVSLTPKGKEVFQRSKELFGEWDQEVLTSLSKEERETLLALMRKISVQKGH